MYILGLFCPKQGQGLKPAAAPLHPTIGQVPPPGNHYLKLDDDRVTTDSAEILDQLKLFYSDLYQDHGSNSDGDEAARFLYNPSIPKLDEDEKEKCEGRLTYNECYRSLLTFQTGKAPGNDGLTAEFYKAFWPLLGNLVVDCL